VVDVRTEEERAVARIDGSRLLDHAYHDASPARSRHADRVPVHHGVRSQYAAKYFRQHGFRNLYSLAGGIDASSLLVDPAVPRD
jgi:monothiol glutaredoxin